MNELKGLQFVIYNTLQYITTSLKYKLMLLLSYVFICHLLEFATMLVLFNTQPLYYDWYKVSLCSVAGYCIIERVLVRR